MTYKELLTGLNEAERCTEKLEAFVATKLAADLDEFGAEWIAEHGEETQMEYAQWFISDLVQASWLSVAAGDNAAQSGTQNAWDTVCDYGLGESFDTSLVAQFIFANFNHPTEDI
jgi:hypothetical protein